MLISNIIKSIYYYILIDNQKTFPTGLLCFCGRQGSGKTISAVNYIYNLKKNYDFVFYSNIWVDCQDGKLQDLSDIFQVVQENRGKNILFFIDEIQGTFSSRNKKGFDEQILRLICQQRKQNIRIVATSQVFSSLAKPFREQCYQVVNCFTFLNRCTFNKFYFADDYNLFFDLKSEKKQKKLRPYKKLNFFQDSKLRKKYDTYEIVNSLIECDKYQKINYD